MNKLNKLNIIKALNDAWVIADSTATLNIENADISITMPVWADLAAVVIDGKEYRVQMENDPSVNDVYTLGKWDLPRLNALLVQ